MACEPNETLINGKCVKKTFLNSPGGIGVIGAALTGVGAAIKNKIANKKADKNEAAQTLKNIKAASSKSKMSMGGMFDRDKKRKKKVKVTSKGGRKESDGFRAISGPSFKVGGMVNTNTKVKNDVSPSTKGVVIKVNSKVEADKNAKKYIGGISKSPKSAVPKVKMGGSKMKKGKC